MPRRLNNPLSRSAPRSSLFVAGRPAHDLALEAESGLLSVTLGSDGKPAMPGIPVADVIAGLQGLSGVLMALFRRQPTGIGDYIDIDCK